MAPTETLSDTEQLILSYLSSHAPEDCMLDKISLGTGKSRATVLKYLGTLHARNILDYRLIGRNKLWQVRRVPPVTEPDLPDRKQPGNFSQVVSDARDLARIRLTAERLRARLDLSNTIVIVVLPDGTITAANRLFGTRFPGVTNIKTRLLPGQVFRFMPGQKPGREDLPCAFEFDLVEKPGITRPYRLTFYPAGKDDPDGAVVILGEDLSGIRQNSRHLESLLYIIRAVQTAADEGGLLAEAMNGIREKLVPYAEGAVIGRNLEILFSTLDIPKEASEDLRPLMERCEKTLETVAVPHEDPSVFRFLSFMEKHTDAISTVVAVPLIREEEAAGAILLFLSSPVSTEEIGNVEIVADELANVMRLLRLDKEKTEYVRTLVAVNRIADILNSAPNEATLLEQSIDTAMAQLGYDQGCVYLANRKDAMVPAVQRNMPDDLKALCASGMFQGLFEQAFARRDVVYLNAAMPEFNRLPLPVSKSGVQTLLVIPIKTGENVVGLLAMGSHEVKSYMQVSLDNIRSIGLQLGMALERSRLAEKLELIKTQKGRT
jgi:hypothetical protein